MRRDMRRKQEIPKWWEDRKSILIASVAFSILVLIVWVTVYSNNNKYNGDNIIEAEKASTSVGKSIEEAENNLNSNTTNETEQTPLTNSNTNNSTTNTTNLNNTNNSTTAPKKETNIDTKKQKTQEVVSEQEKEKVEFEWPVKGDILKAFAIDNLLYSSTLQEWTVHNGIDIKADKTTVVRAAANGTVRSIKNDPRYGLTVIIEHEGGLKTVYSNLLTAEFVVEGEKVNIGQTLGTVGNSANFEIADDSHLHFEILKNGDYVDPMLYLK